MERPRSPGRSDRQLQDAVKYNTKARLVARRDAEGEWWAAGWSGHTIPGVTGPAVPVDPKDLPAVLVHGTYRSVAKAIQREGLLRGRRDVRLHDPLEHSERWRQDLEA